jgi:hypothetical protein
MKGDVIELFPGLTNVIVITLQATAIAPVLFQLFAGIAKDRDEVWRDHNLVLKGCL